ncbi:aldehyde dehydrogenase [Streptomyces sp. NPDC090075]|uniref:aldehyde dehydrogenase n=1 Tax=Streptomyces sp. NPDC090075 TaxID=3365937 RepID=UPI0037FD94FB
MLELAMTIGGEQRRGESTFTSVDPYTGEPWASAPEATEADVRDAVAAASAAFTGEWGALTGRERRDLIRALGRVFAEHVDELAEAETRDNGKLLREMKGQVKALPEFYEYYAGLADKIDGRVVDTGKREFFGFVAKEAAGVVGAVLPWNSPLLLLTFKLAPALAAGCTVVAKPSEHAPSAILRLGSLLAEAGLPPGTVNTVSGSRREVGEWLVGDPRLAHVSFTGSEATGVVVARSAVSNFTPVTLELGGKSANIVFEDADLAAAANGVIAGIFAAAGQTCIAGSRALVHQTVYDELVERVVARARTIKLGNPLDDATEMGPVCFRGQWEKVQHYVRLAQKDGGEIVTGGSDGGRGGLFFEPTVVTGLPNSSAVAQEEIFGPVLTVIPFSDTDEAVEIANDTQYGLAAGIWTRDVNRALGVSRRLRAGTVWVNSYRTLNYSMPFGGRGHSGIGRENGLEGLSDFLVDKAVWIETVGATRDPFVLG